MKKLRIATVVVIAVLAALFAAALFVELDVTGMGQGVLEAAGKDAGIALHAGKIRLNLRYGFVLEDVVATTEIASGTVVTSVDRVVLEHRFWPLLRGDIVVARLVMESPLIEVRNEGNAAELTAGRSNERRWRIGTTAGRGVRAVPVGWAQESAPVAALARDLVVDAASIIDGTLIVRAPDGEATTTVTGLGAEVDRMSVSARSDSIAVGLTAQGHIDVGEVRFADRVARGNRARLSARDGVYTVDGLVLAAPDGRLSLDDLVVDVTRDPYVYRTTLSGENLDLNRLLGLSPAAALGPARFEMEATGTGSEASSVVGVGRVTLSEGEIPDLPVLAQLAERFGPRLAGVRYESTTIDFALGDDRVQIAPFVIISETMRVEASGNLDSRGALDGRARVFVPRQNIDLGSWQGAFSDSIVDALTDESGWVSIPLLIGGKVEEPRVALDYDALLVALQQRTGGGLGKLLQGIIKRN